MSFNGYPVSELTTEEAEPVYQALLADIQQIVMTTGGTGPFENISGGTGACRNDAQHLTFGYDSHTDDPIPDDKWPTVLDEVIALLEADGFDEINVIVDKPGDRVVAIRRSTDGALVQMGTQVASVVSVSSACHPVPGGPTDSP